MVYDAMSDTQTRAISSDVPAWHQREGEPDVAYSAFLHWLHLPMVERQRISMAQLSRDLDYNDKGRSLTTYRKDWDWNARAVAWELDQLAAHTAEAMALRIEGARRHAQVLDQATDLVQRALQELDPSDMSVAEVRALLKLIGEQRVAMFGSLEPVRPPSEGITVEGVTASDDGNRSAFRVKVPSNE